MNLHAVEGSEEDVYRFQPWRAPGYAPVVDAVSATWTCVHSSRTLILRYLRSAEWLEAKAQNKGLVATLRSLQHLSPLWETKAQSLSSHQSTRRSGRLAQALKSPGVSATSEHCPGNQPCGMAYM